MSDSAADEFATLRPMGHGYTNTTAGDETVVVKRYEGPDAAARRSREHHVLSTLAGQLPVPPVVRLDEALTSRRMPGVPGQELISHGEETTRRVLAACGRLLRLVQSVDVSTIFPAESGVLVHGDFGPNNLLIDPETFEPTALVDWEFAHVGDRLRDLAWCEWIVRMHHPERVAALTALFEAYGVDSVPDWPARQQAMLTRCRELREFCVRWTDNGAAVARWDDFITRTTHWAE